MTETREGTIEALREAVPARPTYVVVPDPDLREEVLAALRAEGLEATAFSSADHLLARLESFKPGCIVSGLRVRTPDDSILLRELADRSCPFPVVELAPAGDVETAVTAMKAGAADVVALPLRGAVLAQAVRAAMEAWAAAARGGGIPEAVRLRLEKLTRRERQVLDAIVRGDGNKAIGQELGISRRTVEVHRAKVMEKLSCRTVADVIRLAAQAGLLRP